MLKLTKTGIGLLTRQYRSVLKKCLLLNLGLLEVLYSKDVEAYLWQDLIAYTDSGGVDYLRFQHTGSVASYHWNGQYFNFERWALDVMNGGFLKQGSNITISNGTISAIDTNTHYTTGLYVGASNAKSNAATTNGNTYIKLYDDNTSRASFKIYGDGATTVTSDANGNIKISSTDNNTTYDIATTSAAGLMSAADKTRLENTLTTENYATTLGSVYQAKGSYAALAGNSSQDFAAATLTATNLKLGSNTANSIKKADNESDSELSLVSSGYLNNNYYRKNKKSEILNGFEEGKIGNKIGDFSQLVANDNFATTTFLRAA